MGMLAESESISFRMSLNSSAPEVQKCEDLQMKTSSSVQGELYRMWESSPTDNKIVQDSHRPWTVDGLHGFCPSCASFDEVTRNRITTYGGVMNSPFQSSERPRRQRSCRRIAKVPRIRSKV